MPAARRGLTLFEILVALGLVLALGAISLPIVLSTFDERTFESTGDNLVSGLLLARAHAQTTGAPVEVRYLGEPARVESRLFDAQDVLDDDVVDTGAFTSTVDASAFGLAGGDDSTADRAITAAWALEVLPDGLTIVDARPMPDFTDEDGFAPDPDEPPLERARVVVFMPDGSALWSERLWLVDAEGRVGELAVDPWTGLPTFARLATLDEIEPDEDNPDEDAEADADFEEVRGFGDTGETMPGERP